MPQHTGEVDRPLMPGSSLDGATRSVGAPRLHAGTASAEPPSAALAQRLEQIRLTLELFASLVEREAALSGTVPLSTAAQEERDMLRDSIKAHRPLVVTLAEELEGVLSQ